MKTMNRKRAGAMLLALVLCFALFIGTTSAYAAGESEEVFLIAFPREGDAKLDYSGIWGHDDLQYMNGWKSGSSIHTIVRTMGSFEGNICYCIEPGLTLNIGDSLSSWGEDFWENYPAQYNNTIQPYEIKQFIGRIIQYGYTGPVSVSWASQNEGGDKLAYATATQILIWEAVVGERDSDFNHVSTGGFDAVLDQIGEAHPLRSKILSYYSSIENSVKKHSRLPSFMKRTASMAQSITLEWNGSEYSATLTDPNGVLNDYSFSGSGLSFKISGNDLIITAAEAPAGAVTITAAKKNSGRLGLITWTDGHIQPGGSGLQDMVAYTETVNDPIKGYLKVEAASWPTGVIRVSKTGEVFSSVSEADGCYLPVYSEAGLAGAVFEISAAEDIVTPDGKLCHTKGDVIASLTTDGSGTAVSEPLPYGSYTVRELTAPYGMVINNTPIIVELNDDNTEATANFRNERQKAAIRLTKLMEQNEQFGTGNSGEVRSVRFGLFAAEALTAADGTAIPADGLLERINCDENGSAVFTADIPVGAKLYVREIAADSHYILSGDNHHLSFGYAGQDVPVAELTVNKGEALVNKLILGTVRGLKTDYETGATAERCSNTRTTPQTPTRAMLRSLSPAPWRTMLRR